MSYREKLYSTYVSTHTRRLYGDVSLEGIDTQFPVWKKYFGDFLPINKNAKILDIGCGNGCFIHFLQVNGYKNSIGIDISEEQVALAKNMGIENVLQADLKEYLSGKSENYNVIFVRDVIEHFAKDEVLEILQLIFSSLEDNGMVVIQTPNAESPFGGRYRYGDFTHETAFTRGSLGQIFVATGYKDISFYPTGPVPNGLKSTIRYFLWNTIQLGLKFYMLVETGSKEGIFTQTIIANARK